MSRLFPEYAALPEVFDPRSCSSATEYSLLLKLGLLERLKRSAFLRDMREGEWYKAASRQIGGSIAGREMLEWLKKNKRLIQMKDQGGESWSEEAVKGHRKRKLRGLITITGSPESIEGIPCASLSDLQEKEWWKERGTNMVPRRMENVAEEMGPLLNHGRIILFVDPYFCPSGRGFSKFPQQYLDRIQSNPFRPSVEIHTSASEETNSTDACDYINVWFSDRKIGGKFCVWDKRKKLGGMHDRYLLTDIGGCQLGGGFGESNNGTNTLSVLDDVDRANLMRQFDASPNYAEGLLMAKSVGVSNSSIRNPSAAAEPAEAQLNAEPDPRWAQLTEVRKFCKK